MSANSFPDKPSSSKDLSAFLDKANTLPQRSESHIKQSGRLIFAMDATASRQPSWDRACQLQGQMFLATDRLGGLAIQLCYYRGFNEFHSSPWLSDSQSLLRRMSAVSCLGGHTQLDKVLKHCLQQHRSKRINAVVIIGDAVEESVDTLCAKAGELGLLGVPLFMFQEGYEPRVKHCFQQMAQLSKGAYATFDERSADLLADMLAAVATFASGGYDALQRLPSNAAKQLLEQLKP